MVIIFVVEHMVNDADVVVQYESMNSYVPRMDLGIIKMDSVRT